MNAEIVLKSRNKGYTKKPAIFSIGGHEFVVNGKNIQFDWNMSYSDVTVEPDGTLTVESDLRDFANDIYGDDYLKMGIEVTADLLASAEKIEEIFYECYADEEEQQFIPLQVVSFKIGGKSVKDSVLDDYERRVRDEQTAVES